MKFGYSKYVHITDDEQQKKYPLPNGLTKSYISKLINSYSFTNLSRYNAFKYLFKGGMKFSEYGFSATDVDSLIKDKERFVYPIFISSEFEFARLSDENYYELDEVILDQVNKKNCKILLMYLLEGTFRNKNQIDDVNKFVERYNLNKTDVILITNNLIFNDVVEKNNYEIKFIYYNYNYFLTNFWFLKENFLNPDEDKIKKFEKCDVINRIKQFPKEKNFLILNRKPSPHRIVLFAEIMKDQKLRESSLISMGSKELYMYNGDSIKTLKEKMETWTEAYDRIVSNDFKYNKQSGLEFLEQYDNTKNYFLDANLDYNLAFNINETLHTNTFLNVVTETNIFKNTVFLSEKIFKPIYCCQPFIVLGNQYTLRELKKIGFKTFDKFWDESYDDELNPSKRIEKILDVLNYLNSKTKDTLLKMTNEMIDILEYNFEYLAIAQRNEVFSFKKMLNDQLCD